MFQVILLSFTLFFSIYGTLAAAMFYHGSRYSAPRQFGPSIEEKLSAEWGRRCVMNGNGEIGRTVPMGRDHLGTHVDFNRTQQTWEPRFEKYEQYVHLKVVDCPPRLRQGTLSDT